MADIKIKQKSSKTIKKIDKAKVYTQKLKNNIVEVKDKNNYSSNEESAVEYGSNRLAEETNIVFHKSINKFNDYGQKAAKQTISNVENSKEKINFIKHKLKNEKIQNKSEYSEPNGKTNIQDIRRIEPTINRITSKNNIKIKELENLKSMDNLKKPIMQTTYNNLKNNSNVGVRLAKKIYQIKKITSKKETVKNVKQVTKLIINSLKAIIASTRALIAFLYAALWLVVLFVVFICMIGLICSSPLGIFFSSEKGVGEKTMSSAVSDINIEFIDKITEIQNNTQHDEFRMNSNRAEWKDIISIYAVLVTNGNDQSDVVTLNDKKLKLLRKVFWEMNIINSRVENEIREIEITDSKGKVKKQKVIHKVLYIDITNKSLEEMIQKYQFSDKQLEQLTELQKDKYKNLWSNVLYGSSAGSNEIVRVALEQVGNIGGQPYWSWYGFTNRVEWCACFVSWCANQCNYIENGTIPKFASCQNEGIVWFKTCGLWQERGYIPKARRYYIFRLGKRWTFRPRRYS